MRRGPLPALLAASLVGLGLAVLPADAADQTVSATPSDTFSPADVTIVQGDIVTWHNDGGSHNVRFDDGFFEEPASATTDAWTVDYTFNTVGTFEYYCEQHGGPDGDGMSGTVTVTAAPGGTTTTPPPPPPGGGGGPGQDTTAPVVSRFDLTRTRFRRGKGRKRRGAFTFSLSEPADVRIAIARAAKGRFRTKGSIVRGDLAAGANRLSFSGRIGRRQLAKGRYRATITAKDEAGNRSRPKRESFRVVAG